MKTESTLRVKQTRRALFLLLFFAGVSEAALIDTNRNSFVDTATNLEWMDFGINNQYTIQYTVDNLATLYPGWRLPTQTEAVEMWVNAFSSLGAGGPYDIAYDPSSSAGPYFKRWDQGPSGVTAFQGVFSIMGYNYSTQDAFTRVDNSAGYFFDDYGSLSYLSIYDRTRFDGFGTYDEVDAFGRYVNFDSKLTLVDPAISTLLVRSVSTGTKLSTSFLIFLLALIIWLRLSRDNRHYSR